MAKDKATARVGVIMAGGSGERFWPLSRRLRPKQLLPLTSAHETMLGEAVRRLAPQIPPERVFVVTGRHLLDPIRTARIGIPDENVIAEPCKRNTSGALAYAAAHMLATHGDDVTMAVTTADHLIGDPERFRKTVQVALDAAESHDALATLGVVPDRPETGYGYIQVAGEPITGPGEDNAPAVYRVGAFHEKPNRERAEDFVAAETYFWNSGMFFWRVSTFLSELQEARPDLAQATRDMAQAMQAGDENKVDSIFESLEDISIDYALMEHARHVVMVCADFPWDDVGAWPALDRTMQHDPDGNVTVGGPVVVDCEDCIIYNDAGPEDLAVGVIGMEDVVVVVTRDGVLVAPKRRAQDVRHIVEQIRERGAGQV